MKTLPLSEVLAKITPLPYGDTQPLPYGIDRDYVNHAANVLQECVAAMAELCADRYLADPINADRMARVKAALSRATSVPVN